MRKFYRNYSGENMKCPACSEYMPFGIGLEKCPICNADLTYLEKEHDEGLVSQTIPIISNTGVKEAKVSPRNLNARSIFAFFYFIFFANFILLSIRLAIVKSAFFKMDPAVARLESPWQFFLSEALSMILFWALTLGVVAIAGILHHEKEIQKKPIFLTIVHLCLSSIFNGFGQVVIPVYLMAKSFSLQARQYTLSFGQPQIKTFISSSLIVLPIIAFIGFFHAFAVAATPSKGFLIFEAATGLQRLVLYPMYSIKFLTVVLLTTSFTLLFITAKKFIAATIATLFFVFSLVINFQGAHLYKKFAYSQQRPKIEKLETRDLLKKYSDYHPLGMEIAFNVLKDSRAEEVKELLKGKESLDPSVLWAALVFVNKLKHSDIVPALTFHLENAIENSNFAALLVGIDFLAEINSEESKKVLNELESYASRDKKFEYALRKIQEKKSK